MSQATDIVRNTLKRDGVSQRQRRALALDPSFVKIDERTLGDFLVFAQDFSKQVCYYNLSNQQESDWQDFWKCDPTLVIAAIEKTNPLPLKKAYEQILQNDPSVDGLYQLIQTLTRVAKQIDFWYVNLQERSNFKTELKRLIEANFNTLLPLLVGYENGAKSLFQTYSGPVATDYEGFSGVWNSPISAWNDIEPNISLFQPKVEIGSDEPVACIENFSAAERLKAAYERLNKLLTSTYNVYFQIIQISPTFFQDSLTRKDHPPHLALFISFLMLYQQVQADLNGLTAKHLDFFYKDVLGLKTKEAVPDKVHLFFELAKNIPEHELLAQIRFKAGKDNDGINLFYTLDKNAVLNTAKVESLRTVSLAFEENNSLTRKVKNIHVAPVANSADGLGAPIKDKENPSWATLGSVQRPKAALGFAIASNELLMSEGTRKVTLLIYPQTDLPTLTNTLKLFDTFDIYLSGEKNWIKVTDWIKADTTSLLSFDDPVNSKTIKIEFTLGSETPAVLPFNAKNLKEDLGTTLPVMKILLHQPAENEKNDYPYELLRRLKIGKIELAVDVKDIQQVVAFNDEGAVDTKKPFMPFGSSPKVGSSFYVGNPEAFQKSLDSVTLQLEWEGVPQDFNTHYRGYGLTLVQNDFTFACSIQKNSTSISLKDDLKNDQLEKADPLLFGNSGNNNVYVVSNNLDHAFQSNEIENYGLASKDGFLRIDLQRDFGHDLYQQVLTRQMLAAAKLPELIGGAYYLVKHKTANDIKPEQPPFSADYELNEIIIPKAPYTPVLKSVKLRYTSKSDTTNDTDGLVFLHLHPFANAYQQFKTVKEPQFELVKGPKLKTVSDAFLLPQFTTSQTNGDPEEVLSVNSSSTTTTLEEGALFIGLSQLEPLQSLLLLFQVAENSANAEIPKAKLRWHYLKDNTWLDFKEYQVASDTTDELTTSGIVELSIPEDINKNNTILPADKHWLKVSVSRDAGAVSQLINVHTQATRVTFQDNTNAPTHLEVPLAAQTIAKLEASDSALKSTNQPYESFGGLPAETPLNFYTRISERLRHKGRAITLFDYERLILNAFPTIYKVKCINHTSYAAAADQYQLHPGHVLISVVPDFTKLKAVDRLQPKVTLAKLEEIKRYLEERNTAFVCAADTTLHVLNPAYQKINVDFEVRFIPEVTAIDFHVRKLREAIIRFLSPWAYEDGAEINFGGKMYRSSILNFVEEQPYVDYVANFKMMRDGSAQDLSEIEADTPRSILVPAVEDEKIMIRKILIDGYSPVENLQKGKTLGYLTLEETQINS